MEEKVFDGITKEVFSDYGFVKKGSANTYYKL